MTPTTNFTPNPLLPDWALAMRKEMDEFKAVQKDNQALIEQNNILTQQLQQAMSTIAELQEKIKNLEKNNTTTNSDFPPPSATTIHDSKHAPKKETPSYAAIAKKDSPQGNQKKKQTPQKKKKGA
jgi:hypothetical protein